MVDGIDEAGLVTVNSAVCKQLYYDIMTGKLPAGSRLTINELSQRYKTSTTPVRAALLELQGKGLVTTLPHRGATVRLINQEYLKNVHEVRTAIIRLIIPKCVLFINNADVEHAEGLEAEFKRTVAKGDIAAVLAARSTFYRFIFRLGRNPEAVDVIERTWSIIDILRLRYGVDASRLKLSSAAHKQLLQALARRDADDALEAILESNEKTVRDLLARMERAKAPSL